MISFENTINTLNEYGAKIRDLYREKNIEAGYDPAAELQNISFNVESGDGNFAIVFNLPSYWRWAENGRAPGRMPPPGSLMKWMEFNRILPSQVQLPNGKSYIPSMQSLEFLIRRKIGRDGTEGKHTWEATENEIRDSLVNAVKAAIEKDFAAYIESTSKSAEKDRE